MTTDSDLYQQMTDAVKQRDRAIKMVAKWRQTQLEAESAIQTLFAVQKRDTPDEQE